MTAETLNRGILYDGIHSLPDDYRDFVLEATTTFDHVLELGVGTGRIAAPLLEAGHSVTGVDVDEEMIGEARRKLQQHIAHGRCHLLTADLAESPRIDGKVDAALFSSNTLSLIHSPTDRYRVFAWLRTVVRHAGRVIVILENTVRLIELGFERENERPGVYEGRKIRVLEKRRLDPSAMLWRGENSLIDEEHGPVSPESPVVHAAILPIEVRTMCKLTGFEIEKCYGDYGMSPFSSKSRKSIFFLRRTRID